MFDEFPNRNIFPWNSMVSSYIAIGRIKKLLGLKRNDMSRLGMFTWHATLLVS